MFKSLSVIAFVFGFSFQLMAEFDMSDYKTDYCLESETDPVVHKLLKDENFWRCKDHTISFRQPESTGVGGYNGKCGETAISNVTAMTCGLAIHPDSVGELVKDAGPGLQMKTILKGLTKLQSTFPECSNGKWIMESAKSGRELLTNINYGLRNGSADAQFTRIRDDGSKVSFTPVIVIIRIPESFEIHYVTVVDLLNRNDYGKCKYVINQWKNQYTVPCFEFSQWSYGAHKAFPNLIKSYASMRLQN